MMMVTVLLALEGFIFLLSLAAHPYSSPFLSSYKRSFSKTTVATGDDGANAGSAADKGNADATGLTPSDDAVD